MRVAVVGLGLIGGSVGLAAAGRGDEVVAFDPDPDAAAAGLETGAAASVADSLEGAVADADIAVVAGPSPACPSSSPGRSKRPGRGAPSPTSARPRPG